jgi:poly(3-hydroxybutyrate) depolymerase
MIRALRWAILLLIVSATAKADELSIPHKLPTAGDAPAVNTPVPAAPDKAASATPQTAPAAPAASSPAVTPSAVSAAKAAPANGQTVTTPAAPAKPAVSKAPAKPTGIVLKTLADGTGSFYFPVGGNKKPVEVFTYQPAGTDASTPVIMAMTGVDRNASTYRNDWIKIADQYHFRIVVPRFTDQDFPGSYGYNLGNIQDPKTHHRLPKSQWTFTLVNDIFNAMRQQGITTQSQYYLFGNSAGCQFVHRMLTLLPQPEVKAAICSAAGWWTLPDTDQRWPYGLRASPIKVSQSQLAEYFAKPILIAVGTNDDDPENRLLRHSKGAMAQGVTRLDRAENFFTTSQQQAEQNYMPFNWHFVALPDIGHSDIKMSIYAAGQFSRFEQQHEFNP